MLMSGSQGALQLLHGVSGAVPAPRACLDGMELYHEDTRNGFKYTLGWLHQWACSRSFGLGAPSQSLSALLKTPLTGAD